MRAADASKIGCGVETVECGVAEAVAFFGDPGGMAERLETLADGEPDGGEVADVVGGVAELDAGEGAMVPVSEGESFSEACAGELADELGEADGVGQADEAGGDLRIEDAVGAGAGEAEDGFEVLLAAVDELLDGGIGDEIPEGCEVEAGEGIDECDAVGGGDLYETEFRDVGHFADELAVVGEGADRADVCDEIGQSIGGGDEGGGRFGDQRVLGDGVSDVGVGVGMGGGVADGPVVRSGITAAAIVGGAVGFFGHAVAPKLPAGGWSGRGRSYTATQGRWRTL